MLTDARQLAQNLNERIGPLADNLDATLRDSRKLVNTVDGQTKPLFGSVNKTVQGFEQLARDTNTRLGSLTKSMDKTLTGAWGVMSEDAPLVVALETTLREISDMARSFRLLADYLQRHPEALIQGKGEFGGK
jgi:paraquat-inducible protein B